MKAVQKVGNRVALNEVEKPVLRSQDDVIIQVYLAGLCRTDVYVAQGLIKRAADPIILGHEFSGVVTQTGANVTNVKAGDRVCVMPVMSCNRCETCQSGGHSACPHSTMLGIEAQGAFAEYIAVPAHTVYKLPDTVSFMMGAYMEPIAASHAVLKAGLQPGQKGLVSGDNRIAKLTWLVLQAEGFTNTDLNCDAASLPENTYDFIIETLADDTTIAHLLRALKPHGTLVVKSRKYPPVGIVFNEIVRKELRLIGTNYGAFQNSINLAATGNLKTVEELWGDVYPLEAFEEVFASTENKKLFFSPVEKHVWNR